MGQSLWVRQIVDGHELQIRIFQGSAQHIATDSSEAIDANFDCHISSVDFMKAPNRCRLRVSGKPFMLAGMGNFRKRSREDVVQNRAAGWFRTTREYATRRSPLYFNVRKSTPALEY